jgi:hypothetical protein
LSALAAAGLLKLNITVNNITTDLVSLMQNGSGDADTSDLNDKKLFLKSCYVGLVD